MFNRSDVANSPERVVSNHQYLDAVEYELASDGAIRSMLNSQILFLEALVDVISGDGWGPFTQRSDKTKRDYIAGCEEIIEHCEQYLDYLINDCPSHTANKLNAQLVNALSAVKQKRDQLFSQVF